MTVCGQLAAFVQTVSHSEQRPFHASVWRDSPFLQFLLTQKVLASRCSTPCLREDEAAVRLNTEVRSLRSCKQTFRV